MSSIRDGQAWETQRGFSLTPLRGREEAASIHRNGTRSARAVRSMIGCPQRRVPDGTESFVRKYFGTDGIRGRANGVITPELALKVGQA
ncbi:MAG: hypothetical protein EOO66_29515, partial [Methylobacterium sp.]